MKKRQELIWIVINVLMSIMCILSPYISGDELDSTLGGISFCMAAWYFAGLVDLALFKRKD